jgi:hypothetical protein
MKAANVVIDSILLVGITELFRNGTDGEESRAKQTFFSFGVGFLVSHKSQI